MPLNTGVNSIIHEAVNADFDNNVYIQVYAGADSTPTINGVVVKMGASTTLDITVRTISPTADVFVLGDKRDVAFGAPSLSNSPNP
tara:strand:- start:11439 stop:11696 length:258 start_codon:yes stop_codon:yes gene_type:complete